MDKEDSPPGLRDGCLPCVYLSVSSAECVGSAPLWVAVPESVFCRRTSYVRSAVRPVRSVKMLPRVAQPLYPPSLLWDIETKTCLITDCGKTIYFMINCIENNVYLP